MILKITVYPAGNSEPVYKGFFQRLFAARDAVDVLQRRYPAPLYIINTRFFHGEIKHYGE